MSRAEERLGEREVTQSNLPTPIASDVPAKRAGNLVFTPAKFLLSRDENTKANSAPP